MEPEIIKVTILSFLVIGVGAILMRSGHKDTLLFIFGIAALIFVITTMKGEKYSMGEG